ncbi:hypothetical protein [Pseudomonas syringae]|uniref:hypothetical protein n=1 Tax=Pseudomonas syringae TaxID=317 RepID=UPI0002096B83|nr:hypothetical protein [Pseudomonas syringae]EGH68820.1 hypothetical protein PSYAC_28852 [Pseudomonas syringae pv. actinidiae str. M302091]MDG6387803.1 hypothetical protein [Pseudomonas syringae]
MKNAAMSKRFKEVDRFDVLDDFGDVYTVVVLQEFFMDEGQEVLGLKRLQTTDGRPVTQDSKANDLFYLPTLLSDHTAARRK